MTTIVNTTSAPIIIAMATTNVSLGLSTLLDFLVTPLLLFHPSSLQSSSGTVGVLGVLGVVYTIPYTELWLVLNVIVDDASSTTPPINISSPTSG